MGLKRIEKLNEAEVLAALDNEKVVTFGSRKKCCGPGGLVCATKPKRKVFVRVRTLYAISPSFRWLCVKHLNELKQAVWVEELI